MSGPVLLLEDDPMIRDLLDAVLTDAGHDVRSYGSREQLVSAAADLPGALAVVDFWGHSHERLVEDERAELVQLARAVPTIVVTARTWARAVVAGDLGLVALVRKPFDVDELCTVVSGALEGGTRVGTS